MKIQKAILWRVVESSAVCFFWFQAVRVLFSSLFGVIYDVVFDGDVSLAFAGLVVFLILLALALPAIYSLRSLNNSGQKKQQIVLITTIIIASIARVVLAIDNPTWRLFFSILVLAAINIYLILLIKRHVSLFPIAMSVGLAIDQIVRMCGKSWDVTLQPDHLYIQIAISLIVIGAAWQANCRHEDGFEALDTGRLGFSSGLALGAFLFLESTVLAQPNVLSHWTGVSYEFAAPALILCTLLPLITVGKELEHFGGSIVGDFARHGVLIKIFILFLGVLPGFTGWITDYVRFGWLLLAQLILVSTLPMLFTNSDEDNSEKSGAAVALGMVGFLVLNLAFAFTFTYAYTIPQFRDMGTIICSAAAIIIILPIALKPPQISIKDTIPINNNLVAGILLLFALALVASKPEAIHYRDAGKSIVAATYNIHYGYDTYWHFTLDDQASAIEKSNADIVFLQEVDGGRITSYGVDDALWLANRLGMKAIFAPAMEGLSGVALLTRLPVTEHDWSFLPSELEQTAIVHTRVIWDDSRLDAFGVWLGLEKEERLTQINAALDVIGGENLVLLGGDMNCEPYTQEYNRILENGLVDPFTVTGNSEAVTDPAVNPTKRIDYIWVRGANSKNSWVSNSLASDHRLVAVSLELME